MDNDLGQLKQEFKTIQEIKNKVTVLCDVLQTYLQQLKRTHSEFIVNNTDMLYIFGLDSFHFQHKLIDIEFDDMKRIFLIINNRMYCEYYKLYKIITEYIKENIEDKKVLELTKTNFPTYQDLEPYKQYKFDLIQEIHQIIILYMYGLSELITTKENNLLAYKKKQENGLNINNFVSTYSYSIILLKERCKLFISYISFFHSLHTKYLQRFSMKLNLMYNQVSHDIKFEETPKNSEIKKKELLDTFEEQKIDKQLLMEIKKSVEEPNVDGVPILKQGLFKNNVKKLINGMRLFKSKDNNDSINSKESVNTDDISNSKESINNNDSLDNNDIVHTNKNININEHINSNEIENEEVCYVDANVSENIFTDKYKEELNRTITTTEVFNELTKQCDKIINKENLLSISLDNEIFLENKLFEIEEENDKLLETKEEEVKEEENNDETKYN